MCLYEITIELTPKHNLLIYNDSLININYKKSMYIILISITTYSACVYIDPNGHAQIDILGIPCICTQLT